jgi:hypothetical protein
MNERVVYVLAEPREACDGWHVVKVTKTAWTREKKLQVETATSTGETLMIKVMTCPSNMLDLWSAHQLGVRADEIWQRIEKHSEMELV